MSITPIETLVESIKARTGMVRSGIPADRRAALLAVVRHLDRLPATTPATDQLDLVTCALRPDLGAQLALRLLLSEASTESDSSFEPGSNDLANWATGFLEACRHLEMARLILLHAESGTVRLNAGADGALIATVIGGLRSARVRERADFEWWQAYRRRMNGGSDPDPLAGMVYQFDYPPATVFGGITVGIYRAVIAWLAAAVADVQRATLFDAPIPELELATLIADDLDESVDIIRDALQPLALDAESAIWHDALPGVANPPAISVGGGEVVLSRRGLTDEPLLFLARELRRLNAPGYHDAAHFREETFRADLYDIFANRRFVHSAGGIVLRWPDRKARTNIDAAVFDRKTGTLALFELKSIDPFARTIEELHRQRDNVLYANRQVSGVLDWINRHGADDILNRIDRQTAKKFRVQRVLPFVLCRFLARFGDGLLPDSRAAWASWPEVLRSLEQHPIGPKDSNPLLSLFTRLTGDTSPPITDGEGRVVEIDLEPQRVTVIPRPVH